MRVAFASDHAGVQERMALIEAASRLGWETVDLGPPSAQPVDYPAYAQQLGALVARGEVDRGVLLCGTGIGMSIAANKVPGVRAALVHEALSARLARQHNDANVLVLGARVTGIELMKAALEAFLAEPFTPGDDGRHARRVAALERPHDA